MGFLAALVGGAALLAFSADRFVEGAATTARYLRVPPLVIGMVIVGFGTSAPELVVSTLAALEGNSSIALGNAVGSNIANLGLILGVTALVRPVPLPSRILRAELPILLAGHRAARGADDRRQAGPNGGSGTVVGQFRRLHRSAASDRNLKICEKVSSSGTFSHILWPYPWPMWRRRSWYHCWEGSKAL